MLMPAPSAQPPDERTDMLAALIRWSIQNRFLVLMGNGCC